MKCNFPGCDAEAEIVIVDSADNSVLFSACLEPLRDGKGLGHAIDFMQGPSRALGPRRVLHAVTDAAAARLGLAARSGMHVIEGRERIGSPLPPRRDGEAMRGRCVSGCPHEGLPPSGVGEWHATGCQNTTTPPKETER